MARERMVQPSWEYWTVLVLAGHGNQAVTCFIDVPEIRRPVVFHFHEAGTSLKKFTQ
jgi:hypothetical protein